jgi:NitT/TauT family transport system substrate-binding protein
VLHLAQEGGYFARAGLEVQLHESVNSRTVIPLLAGGKLDIVLSRAGPSLVNAVLRGAELRLVAGREITSPVCGDFGTLYGNRKAFPQGFSNVLAVRGKRVSVLGWSDLTGFFLDVLLESAGLNSEDVRAVILRHEEAVPLLLNGQIDAMLNHDFEKCPHEVQSRLVRGPAFSRLHPYFQYSYVIFGRRLLRMDPAVGGAFLAAYLRAGVDFLKGKTPAFLEEYARRNRWEPQRLREDCRETFTVDGTIHLDHLQFQVDWAARHGYILRGMRGADLIDLRFLEQARRSQPAQAAAGGLPHPEWKCC